MKIYATVEIRNGERLRDDGSYMTNADRKGPQPMPINDTIWFAEPSAPGPWDRRNMGQFCIDCATQAEAEDVMDDAGPSEGATTLRIVWERTPFTAEELATIQKRVPDDDPILPIPTMSYAEFKAATLPENSAFVIAMAVDYRDFHAGRVSIGEQLLVTAPERDRAAIEKAITEDARFRDSFEAERVEYAKRLVREEDLPRREEVTRG